MEAEFHLAALSVDWSFALGKNRAVKCCAGRLAQLQVQLQRSLGISRTMSVASSSTISS